MRALLVDARQPVFVADESLRQVIDALEIAQPLPDADPAAPEMMLQRPALHGTVPFLWIAARQALRFGQVVSRDGASGIDTLENAL